MKEGEEPKETKYEKVFVGKIPIMLRYRIGLAEEWTDLNGFQIELLHAEQHVRSRLDRIERVSIGPGRLLRGKRVGESTDRAGEDGHQHGLRVLNEGRQIRVQDRVSLLSRALQVYSLFL